MIRLLHSNVETLRNTQGGGYHGCISLIMKLLMYTTLSNTACSEPTDPRVYPMVPSTATVAHHKKLQKQNDEKCCIYDNAVTME